MDKKISIIAPDCDTTDLFDKDRFDIVVAKENDGSELLILRALSLPKKIGE
jgi:hypothetical protein